ncbi:unnamed protein product [Euphydryas editha]|uniref:Uncharacterized protein n=1 Tax=Euphydryas editha TaxID=104508 RepID=A0AAU9THF6_EUPED|nr:unnamed protein product [Euphydryas editha]
MTLHDAHGQPYGDVIIVQIKTERLRIHDSVPQAVAAVTKDTKICLLADAEAALNAALPTTGEVDGRTSELSHTNLEVSVVLNKELSQANTPEETPDWSEISSVFLKRDPKPEEKSVFVKPIILINDKLPEDLDQKWTHIVETLPDSEKLNSFQTRRKFKRKFCRRKRPAHFKRSYSIG